MSSYSLRPLTVLCAFMLLLGACAGKDASPDRAVPLSSLTSRVDQLARVMEGRNPRGRNTSFGTAEAQADLQELFAALERVHPDHLGAFASAEEYERLKTLAAGWITQLSVEGKISDVDLALVLHYCIASLRDGHTSMHIHWTNAAGFPLDQEAWPPFILDTVDGHYVMAQGLGKLAPHRGKRIKRIQGREIEDFLLPAFLAVSHESKVMRDHMMTGEQNFFLALSGIYEGMEHITIEFDDGVKVTEGIIPLYKFNYIFQKLPRFLKQHPESTYTMLDDEVMYYDYVSCDGSPQGLEAIDEAFRFAADHQAQELIIDLRYNGGGSSNAGERMVSHFYAGEYRQFRKVDRRYSEDAQRTSREHYPDDDLGRIKTYELPRRQEIPQEPFFPGRVHLITGPGTFSAAVGLSQMFKDYAMGTIWGYETGGVRSCHGNYLTLALPTSRWDIHISWKTFYSPEPVADEFSRGVIPDHLASAEILAPFATEADPLLAWVHHGIKALP